MDKLMKHQSRKGYQMKTGSGSGKPLIVTGQAPKTRHPGKRALDDPVTLPPESFSISDWLSWFFPFVVCLYDILIRVARQGCVASAVTEILANRPLMVLPKAFQLDLVSLHDQQCKGSSSWRACTSS